MTIYILRETSTNNETSTEGVVSDKAIAEQWSKLFGCWVEEFELDDLTNIAPYLPKDENR